MWPIPINTIFRGWTSIYQLFPHVGKSISPIFTAICYLPVCPNQSKSSQAHCLAVSLLGHLQSTKLHRVVISPQSGNFWSQYRCCLWFNYPYSWWLNAMKFHYYMIAIYFMLMISALMCEAQPKTITKVTIFMGCRNHPRMVGWLGLRHSWGTIFEAQGTTFDLWLSLGFTIYPTTWGTWALRLSSTDPCII